MAAVGGRVWIAESLDESSCGQTGGGDAGGEPGLVHLREETGDLAPAGAFTGFAGIAYEDEVEVEGVTGGVDHAVGSAAEEVAEDGQELEEEGGGVGFGVGRDGADGLAGQAVQGGFGQVGMGGWGWRCGAG